MVRAFPASTATVQTQSNTAFTKNYKTAERILQSFNTWAFKREQPSDPKLMLAFVVSAIERHEPIRFVVYWGKGARHALAGPDVQCLDYLSGLARRVRENYPHGASINLLFTDTHAELNGYLAEEVEQYFSTVEEAAMERGFGCFRLGRIARAAGPMVASHRWEAVDAEMLRRLSQCAMKWYKGEGTPERGALKYFRLNIVEKRAVELAFPRSIFVTFNSSEYRILFPDRLPILSMYSMGKRSRSSIGFMSEEATAPTATPRPASI